MVNEDLKPSDILTRQAFENAIIVNSAIGGSTNAPPHIQAIAKHMGVPMIVQDWQTIGYDVPLLVNCQPSGHFLGEGYFRAGAVPAVMHELAKAGRLHTDCLTVSGRRLAENIRDSASSDGEVIRPYDRPLIDRAGFLVLSGNLFDAALLKTSGINPAFRKRYLSQVVGQRDGQRNRTTGDPLATRQAEDVCQPSSRDNQQSDRR